MEKSEGKRSLARPRYSLVDNIKMDLRKTGWGGMGWVDLVQERDQWWILVNTELYFRIA
jgi:hypothetical protein